MRGAPACGDRPLVSPRGFPTIRRLVNVAQAPELDKAARRARRLGIPAARRRYAACRQALGTIPRVSPGARREWLATAGRAPDDNSAGASALRLVPWHFR